jgi:hypothetical protein
MTGNQDVSNVIRCVFHWFFPLSCHADNYGCNCGIFYKDNTTFFENFKYNAENFVQLCLPKFKPLFCAFCTFLAQLCDKMGIKCCFWSKFAVVQAFCAPNGAKVVKHCQTKREKAGYRRPKQALRK